LFLQPLPFSFPPPFPTSLSLFVMLFQPFSICKFICKCICIRFCIGAIFISAQISANCFCNCLSVFLPTSLSYLIVVNLFLFVTVLCRFDSLAFVSANHFCICFCIGAIFHF